ncbi:hypothetical protein N7493_010073 [Penicillium malachiteum]|uniref:C2H2-type domain-containing protein n=1 Tax=Penicillium malachiteum TaxID=1324776 RepID=A0AAD6HE13_9EURO|nr:hypothetical protein N7493_010073 [Penicillium malachiteum]
MRLGPKDLLEYNARYKVLICRDCQYAIQKNALGSHLLRHKIYREERQRLLSTINDLDIVEADALVVPNINAVPIDALPVVSGYCCSLTGCGHLCASSKRMRRHWSEAHGADHDRSNDFSSLARSVKLQTFFRGTKIKYFEVSTTSCNPLAEPLLSNDGIGHGKEGSRLNAVQYTPNSVAFLDVDLKVLTHFHHFTTATCLSLPGNEGSLSALQYWEKEVIPLALQQKWIMCGLLAISAYHSATPQDSMAQDKSQIHHERITKLASEFRVGFSKITNDDTTTTVDASRKVSNAGIKIKSILNCLQLTLDRLPMSHRSANCAANLSQLQSLLRDIRNVMSPESGPFSYMEQEIDEENSEFRRALFKNGSLENDPRTVMLQRHIDELPCRMAAIFGRPRHEQDAPAIIHAIGTLSKCHIHSLESDDLSSVWHFMVAWLIETTEHFNRLVSDQNPAALVVLAYWGVSLVKRAENCGSWFINGLTRKLLLSIQEHLSSDNATGALVQELWIKLDLR